MKTQSDIPFERLPGESSEEFAALLAHRDSGPSRRIKSTALQLGKSESTIRRIAYRWNWSTRLDEYDALALKQLAVEDGMVARASHREKLEQFRKEQERRANQLSEAADQLIELVIKSAWSHLKEGRLLNPAQLAAALSAAARASEAAGNTVATALGVDELISQIALTDAE